MNSNIGRQATDKITGFKGTITGFVQYITGCNQYLVASKSKDGKALGEAQWLDEQRVTVTGKALTLDNSRTPGPDIAPPIR